MKKIEPAKNVTPMPGRGVEAHCAASEASRKHVAPVVAVGHERLRARRVTGRP